MNAMTLLEVYQSPQLRPKVVSEFVGIPGSALPRVTRHTIGQPAQPPTKRGGRGMYSILNAILIKLGWLVLDAGLLPAQAAACINDVKSWILDVITDDRFFAEHDKDFYAEKMGRWIVGAPSAGGIETRIVNQEELVDFLVSDEISARPHLIMNLRQFMDQEARRLIATVEAHSSNEI